MTIKKLQKLPIKNSNRISKSNELNQIDSETSCNLQVTVQQSRQNFSTEHYILTVQYTKL